MKIGNVDIKTTTPQKDVPIVNEYTTVVNCSLTEDLIRNIMKEQFRDSVTHVLNGYLQEFEKSFNVLKNNMNDFQTQLINQTAEQLKAIDTRITKFEDRMMRGPNLFSGANRRKISPLSKTADVGLGNKALQRIEELQNA